MVISDRVITLGENLIVMISYFTQLIRNLSIRPIWQYQTPLERNAPVGQGNSTDISISPQSRCLFSDKQVLAKGGSSMDEGLGKLIFPILVPLCILFLYHVVLYVYQMLSMQNSCNRPILYTVVLCFSTRNNMSISMILGTYYLKCYTLSQEN